MQRNFRIGMYKDLEVETYFTPKSLLDNIPIICHQPEEDALMPNELVFLVDESNSMDLTIGGITRWEFVKYKIIKPIIDFVENRVFYSYITSRNGLTHKLMNNFSMHNALSWIESHERQDGWNAKRGWDNAHKSSIWASDAVLVIITDGLGCSDNGCTGTINPITRYGHYYLRYFVFYGLGAGQECFSDYFNTSTQFNTTLELQTNSGFNYRHVQNETTAANAIQNFFMDIGDMEYLQQTPGLPETEYEILSPRTEAIFNITTDENGYFSDDDLDKFDQRYPYMVNYQNTIRYVGGCVGYEPPEIPIGEAPPHTEPPEDIQEFNPTLDRYVHISDVMMGDEIVYGQMVKINEPQDWCVLLGSKKYENLSITLDNISSIDGIAISEHVKVVFFSKPNFEGDILLDVIGPVILHNSRLKRDDYINFHYMNYIDANLQEIYPQEKRLWVPDLQEWKSGSVIIQFLKHEE